MRQGDQRRPHGFPPNLHILRRLQIETLTRTFPVAHLAKRFFQVLRPETLSPAEQALVARHLRGLESALFWAQTGADQRHALETMRRVRHFTEDPEALRAALLHDVGKAQVELGAIGRSVATVLDVFGLPMPSAMRAYREHGPRGAAALAAAGVEPLGVDFARRHPDPDPGDHDPVLWAWLLAADDV